MTIAPCNHPLRRLRAGLPVALAFSGITLSLICCPDLAWSATPNIEQFYVNGMVSIIDDDVDRDVDDTEMSGLQLGLGYRASADWAVEFTAVGTSFHADGFNNDQKQWGLGVDFIWQFAATDNFKPYALIGTGFLKTQRANLRRPDSAGPMISAGVGLLTPVNFFDLSLRTELRVRNDYGDGVLRDYLLSFGLQRPLRVSRNPPPDRDGDNVADAFDRCEDTPRGRPVDRFGCADVADRDADGVPDYIDKCDNTPSGTAVDAAGCPSTRE